MYYTGLGKPTISYVGIVIGNGGDKVKFEIELDKYDIGQMQKNRYGHNDVLTKDYMLDILHDIVDQIHKQMEVK